MKSKKSMIFFVISIVLTFILSTNTFAYNNYEWECIYQNSSKFSIGDIIYSPSSISLTSDSGRSAEVSIKSQFDVKSGDDIWMYYETELFGNKEKFDEAASICSAEVIAENGEVLIDMNFFLGGSNNLQYGSRSAKITEETSGKLTIIVSVEGTGCRDVGAWINAINFELNGNEI